MYLSHLLSHLVTKSSNHQIIQSSSTLGPPISLLLLPTWCGEWAQGNNVKVCMVIRGRGETVSVAILLCLTPPLVFIFWPPWTRDTTKMNQGMLYFAAKSVGGCSDFEMAFSSGPAEVSVLARWVAKCSIEDLAGLALGIRVEEIERLR